MGKFIAKRLLQLIPILFAVSIIAFGLVRVLPGGAAVAFLRAKNITPTAEAVAQTEKTLGLDKSVPEQYLIWVKDAVKLDFGKSYISNKRITPEVFGSFLNTFGLAAMALVWVVLFSFPLGAISSLRRLSLPSRRHLNQASSLGRRSSGNLTGRKCQSAP